MKKRQNVKSKVSTGLAYAAPAVAAATKDLSDEEAVDLADEILHKLAPVAARLQNEAIENARAEHADSEARKVVAEHGEDVCRAIQSALDTLSPLDDATLKLLNPILCESELLVYPTWEFSETLSAREIVAYGRPVVAALKPGGCLSTDPKVFESFRRLVRDDISALRRTTAEYHVQKKVFELLCAYCEALATKLRESACWETATMGLGILHMLDMRTRNPRECLSGENARAFVPCLRTFLQHFTRDMTIHKERLEG